MDTKTISSKTSSVDKLGLETPCFKFSKELDSNFLENNYGQNINFAFQIFELFVNTIEDDLTNLESHVKSFDFKKINQTTHKIKTSFLYVGLRSMYDILIQLEEDSQAHSTNVSTRLNEVLYQFESKFDIIKKELDRMSRFLLA